jgi:hypothetical protein
MKKSIAEAKKMSPEQIALAASKFSNPEKVFAMLTKHQKALPASPTDPSVVDERIERFVRLHKGGTFTTGDIERLCNLSPAKAKTVKMIMSTRNMVVEVNTGKPRGQGNTRLWQLVEAE